MGLFVILFAGSVLAGVIFLAVIFSGRKNP
jgi:hypothetical protein